MAAQQINFCDLNRGYKSMKGEIDEQIADVLATSRFIMGPKIQEIEEKLSSYVGVKHCIAVSDGTAAIQVALMALDVGPGDEVITVPFTWISTAEVVPLCGATVRFVDVDPNTFNMDVSKLEAVITPKTKAIIAVSLFGQMADLSSIMRIAEKYNISVIEDAAQSFGATRDGQRSCSVAKISTTSFFPSKPFGCYGDGGAVFTNDDEIAKRISAIRTHGANKRHSHWCVGMNARLDAMQAGILLGQWKHLPEILASRTRSGTLYSKLLSVDGCEGVYQTPQIESGCASVYAQYTLKLGSSVDREAVRASLKELGVPTAVYYPKCLHKQQVFENDVGAAANFPEAEECADRVLSLPMHSWMNEEEIRYVASRVKHVLLGDELPPAAPSAKLFEPHVLVVGAGYWGKNHVRTFHKLGALSAICDPYESLLKTYAEPYPEAILETDLDKALALPGIKAVSIAAPAFLHYRLAVKALQAGKHVLVEKPMCMDITEAEQLVDLASKCDKTLAVGHLLRYHPGFLRLHEVVKSGKLGKIRHITSNRLSLGKFREEENVLWSFAPHDISMAIALCGGRKPEAVTCTGSGYITEGIEDDVSLTMHFKSGVKAQIRVSWVSPVKEHRLTVVGSKGMAVFDDTKPWGEKVCIFGEFAKYQDGLHPQPTAGTKDYTKSGSHEDIAAAFPLDEEFKCFLNAAAGKTSVLADGREGLFVLEALHAAQESMDSDGAPVRLTGGKKKRDPTIKVHSTAILHDDAKVGKNTRIWQFTHVMKGSSVGASCNIGQNCVLHADCSLGSNCKVQNNVSVYGGVHCADNVFLGPSMVFTNVKTPRSAVNRRGEYSTTILEEGASVGANATIVCGVTLGKFCLVGAGSVVTKDVKAYSLVVGNPARHIGWVGENGERLVDSGKDGIFDCPATGTQYRLVDGDLAKI